MPQGIYFLVHDEIKGPEIKSSYFTSSVTLPKEFISKLYMSHAGLDSSSLIEIKFDRYKSVSCYTGSLDRRSEKEGILGILFEENEQSSNIDLFLRRNLLEISNRQEDRVIEEIYKQQLVNFLEIAKIFETVEFEDIPEIFIITGNEEFKSCLLNIGDGEVSTSDMIDIYKDITERNEITQYHYVKLNIELSNNTYLILKVSKPIQEIDKIISTIKPYLEDFFFYSLEILALFLIPSLIRIVPFSPKIAKKYVDKFKSILQNLQKSKNYGQEFNTIISYLKKGDLYLSPLTKNLD